jgi:DNA uptake protein ComE-like DNA-binding protein
LSERQARSIHRYEEKGGSFRTKKDLARMRVVSPELFAQWQPYILLPDSFPTKAGEHPDNRRDHRDQDTTRWEQRPYAGSKARAGTTIRSVELNSADSAALVAVRGIGPAFAHAIIRYRERLGGYRSLDQLQEVYLLRDKPEAVERLREHLVVDPALVRRIDINRCEAKELAAHPYIGWNLAKALVAYRDRHGPYKQVADISGCALVTDSLRGRIEPYLSVGP